MFTCVINVLTFCMPQVIDDLKSRLGKTRELRKPLEGTGWTYGVDTEYIKTILDYWRTKYDWNKRQTLLNKYPQFKTNIQGNKRKPIAKFSSQNLSKH